MKIEHNKTDKGGKFAADNDGKEIAEMTYKYRGSDIVIEHTFVEEAHRNEGLGGKLVKSAVDFARNESIKIIPQCPFAREEFKENPEYSDVLK